MVIVCFRIIFFFTLKQPFCKVVKKKGRKIILFLGVSSRVYHKYINFILKLWGFSISFVFAFFVSGRYKLYHPPKIQFYCYFIYAKAPGHLQLQPLRQLLPLLHQEFKPSLRCLPPVPHPLQTLPWWQGQGQPCLPLLPRNHQFWQSCRQPNHLIEAAQGSGPLPSQ